MPFISNPVNPRAMPLSEEVLDQICCHLNQRSLLSLCLVSRQWLTSSTKCLFYEPLIRDDGRTADRVTRSMKFLQTLQLDNPDLANHVYRVDQKPSISDIITMPESAILCSSKSAGKFQGLPQLVKLTLSGVTWVIQSKLHNNKSGSSREPA